MRNAIKVYKVDKKNQKMSQLKNNYIDKMCNKDSLKIKKLLQINKNK
jgi:hypothetical protein